MDIEEIKRAFEKTRDKLVARCIVGQKYKNQSWDGLTNAEQDKFICFAEALVEEKLTSTNNASVPCCSNEKCEKFSTCKCNNRFYICPSS